MPVAIECGRLLLLYCSRLLYPVLKGGRGCLTAVTLKDCLLKLLSIVAPPRWIDQRIE